MARVFGGERLLLTPVLGPIERLLYRVMRTDPEREQDWKGYARTVIVFSFVSWLALYLILRTQGIHPFNPQGFAAAPWDVTFNTTSSFVTNTNWQYYAGETTLSNFSQMAGLAVQNFVSAAVGIAVVVAVIRGFSRRSGKTLGNFWADLIRTLLYILLPISVVGALVLVSQGVIQTLSPNIDFTTLTGGQSTLAVGPVASQEVIKELGTNGGGFFNVNSAMPFENPNGISNFFELLADPDHPRGPHGHVRADGRQPAAGLGAVLGDVRPLRDRRRGRLRRRGARLRRRSTRPGIAGGNLEGKETRFGITNSALWTAVTTVTSCGAVNAALDSLTGIGGAIPMSNMMLGEVVFGGVGSGLYGMLLFVLLAVFIAGLMVGRTPEYLGKKIEARDVKLVMIGTLAMPLLVLFARVAGDGDEVRRAIALQRRARRASPSTSTPTPRRRTTTARRSPATRASCSRTRRATAARSASPTPTSSAASPCSSGASCHCSPRSPSAGRWSPSGSLRSARARCARTPRSSSSS